MSIKRNNVLWIRENGKKSLEYVVRKQGYV